MSAAAVLIGVGNEYRRDDGAAKVLVERIARHPPFGVDYVFGDGDPVFLLDTWTGRDLAVVVDTARCEPPHPGRIHRTLEIAFPAGASGASHALGIPEAVRLGRALGRMPARLAIYTVEAADLGFGVGLSSAVSDSLSELERSVRAELSEEPA